MKRAEQVLDILVNLVNMRDSETVFGHRREGLLAEFTLAEAHCIDWIGVLDHPNVTKIARLMGVTRGAVSKLSKKLLKQGLIESYQEPDNSKEIYFRLTGKALPVYEEHKKIHQEVRGEWMKFFANFSDGEQEVLLRFFTRLEALLGEKTEAAGRQMKGM
ncbi:MAG: MarR family transcriptional regulator [Gracilibacteraceae bacterium]|jgi:DNA-binding MarR family transcriptional regulator|nr:MarR family transcriptional regulator [Gracilibacteraceae bacterium]